MILSVQKLYHSVEIPRIEIQTDLLKHRRVKKLSETSISNINVIKSKGIIPGIGFAIATPPSPCGNRRLNPITLINSCWIFLEAILKNRDSVKMHVRHAQVKVV